MQTHMISRTSEFLETMTPPRILRLSVVHYDSDPAPQTTKGYTLSDYNGSDIDYQSREGTIGEKRSTLTEGDSVDPVIFLNGQGSSSIPGSEHKSKNSSHVNDASTSYGLEMYNKLEALPFSMRRPQRMARKPVQYYRTENNKIRRIYRNRCERYCVGPVSILVDGAGVIVITLVNLVMMSIAVMLIAVAVAIDKQMGLYNETVALVKANFRASLHSVGVDHSGQGIFLHIEKKMEHTVVPLVMMGVILGTISIMGIAGAMFNHQGFLYLYTRISVLLLLVEFCTYLFIYDGEPDILKEQMVNSLKTYSGVEGRQPITAAWNVLMDFLHCCGVDNYLDFKRSVNWPPSSIKNVTYSLKTPVFCCMNKKMLLTH
ncbi:hypothetical protein EGW08_016857 [Elysia chlorotica]|uniref:Tetraspanin n=1 Tax=Elysia chlorotica TaxID=188477 RepID=A0A433T1K1_ELYCH|nr:hypothetical protein EGW08_016857 [Elysia chlorotica]